MGTHEESFLAFFNGLVRHGVHGGSSTGHNQHSFWCDHHLDGWRIRLLRHGVCNRHHHCGDLPCDRGHCEGGEGLPESLSSFLCWQTARANISGGFLIMTTNTVNSVTTQLVGDVAGSFDSAFLIGVSVLALFIVVQVVIKGLVRSGRGS